MKGYRNPNFINFPKFTNFANSAMGRTFKQSPSPRKSSFTPSKLRLPSLCKPKISLVIQLPHTTRVSIKLAGHPLLVYRGML